jgi:hypothetical protein
MSAHLSLAPLLESFFRSRLTNQRNVSSSTVASYRDALRILVLFVAERTGRKPSALSIADFDRDLVLAFLDDLEVKRKKLDSDAKRAPDGDPILFPSCGGERPGVAGDRPTHSRYPAKKNAYRSHASSVTKRDQCSNQCAGPTNAARPA